MDVFNEQLVKVKLNASSYIMMVLTVLAAAFLAIFLFLYSLEIPILILLVVGVIYGEVKLLGFFSVEYEYIITNGTVDVDKITAKSSRKRILSFECKDIIRSGKYNFKSAPVTDAAVKLICCTPGDSEAYYLLVNSSGKRKLLVFTPNDKTKAGIRECAPRIISQDLFND